MARKLLTPTDEQLAVLRTLNTSQAAETLHVSRHVARRWVREYLGEEQRARGRPCRGIPDGLREQLGRERDTVLSERHRVPLTTLRNYRRRLGIPPFTPEPGSRQVEQQAA